MARVVLTVRGPARSTPPARSPVLRYGAGFRRCRHRRRHAPPAPESTRDAHAACSGRSFTTPLVLVEFTVIHLRFPRCHFGFTPYFKLLSRTGCAFY